MNKSKKNRIFLEKYLIDLSNLIRPKEKIISQLLKVKDIFLKNI